MKKVLTIQYHGMIIQSQPKREVRKSNVETRVKEVRSTENLVFDRIDVTRDEPMR